jgi:adenosylcobinamide kinase / adenosylcobinamide-phosphate guanylyltransferase
MKTLVLIGGGARSGKSRFALRRAEALGARRLFVATAEPRTDDPEMRARIARHRAERGPTFDTVEEPLALPELVAAADGRAHDVLVVDCLTLWLSNLLCGGAGADEALARVEALCASLRERRAHVVLVTNEVGMGIVPETPLGRLFRDVAGLAHQRLARDADEIHFAVLGMMLRVRPGPVTSS